MFYHRRLDMNRLALACLLALGSLAACGTTDGPPAGYVRFEPPKIMVPPGASGQWIQYVSLPVDQDMDVTDLVGTQSPGGHHVILYATPTSHPVGTTREWRAT